MSDPQLHGLTFGQPFNTFHIFNGSFIPEGIVSFYGLSFGAKMVLGRLYRYCGKDSVSCHPSLEDLADDICSSVRQVSRYLAELLAQRFISKRRVGLGYNNEYYILFHPAYVGDRGTPPPGGGSDPDQTELSDPDQPSDPDQTEPSDQDKTDMDWTPGSSQNWRQMSSSLRVKVLESYKESYTSDTGHPSPLNYPPKTVSDLTLDQGNEPNPSKTTNSDGDLKPGGPTVSHDTINETYSTSEPCLTSDLDWFKREWRKRFKRIKPSEEEALVDVAWDQHTTEQLAGELDSYKASDWGKQNHYPVRGFLKRLAKADKHSNLAPKAPDYCVADATQVEWADETPCGAVRECGDVAREMHSLSAGGLDSVGGMGVLRRNGQDSQGNTVADTPNGDRGTKTQTTAGEAVTGDTGGPGEPLPILRAGDRDVCSRPEPSERPQASSSAPELGPHDPIQLQPEQPTTESGRLMSPVQCAEGRYYVPYGGRRKDLCPSGNQKTLSRNNSALNALGNSRQNDHGRNSAPTYAGKPNGRAGTPELQHWAPAWKVAIQLIEKHPGVVSGEREITQILLQVVADNSSEQPEALLNKILDQHQKWCESENWNPDDESEKKFIPGLKKWLDGQWRKTPRPAYTSPYLDVAEYDRLKAEFDVLWEHRKRRVAPISPLKDLPEDWKDEERRIIMLEQASDSIH